MKKICCLYSQEAASDVWKQSQWDGEAGSEEAELAEGACFYKRLGYEGKENKGRWD